jgi:hypothetical protein
MKNIGGGVLWLTVHPIRMRVLSERSESKDLSLNSYEACRSPFILNAEGSDQWHRPDRGRQAFSLR